MKNTLAFILGATLVATGSLRANSYTLGDTVSVTEAGVNPGLAVTINSSTLGNNLHVLAGVVKLVVDGVSVSGFCIDPYQWSSSSARDYTVTDLASAPQSPYSMTASAADTIKKLWAMNFSTSMTAELAAGLQIAIWETVAGANFSVVGSDHGAATLIANLASYSGSGANLVGLTNRTYQDYVVENVPDGGSSVVLLGLGLLGLAMAKRRFKA